ncbi:MAG: hypothetical protein HY238_20380 [Acidobacteria bacterium]|nr:hypothetical protein [Acidobacteriota bacterium]
MERLARAGFQLLPALQITSHYVLERDGFVALVERLPDGSFGQSGAPGLLTEGAIAQLVWKKEGPRFVAKGFNRPATTDQVESLRRFHADLSDCLLTPDS